MKIILLDAGPLGLITNPRPAPQAKACREWLDGLLARGVHARVPEIIDYELRRELLRARKTIGLEHLDALAVRIGYLPLQGHGNTRSDGRPAARPAHSGGSYANVIGEGRRALRCGVQLSFDQRLQFGLLIRRKGDALIPCGAPACHQLVQALLLRCGEKLIRAQTLHNHQGAGLLGGDCAVKASNASPAVAPAECLAPATAW